MNIQPHTFLFNFQKRLDSILKTISKQASNISFSFLPPKSLFNTVGKSFSYVKVDDFLSVIDINKDVALQLQQLIDSIIYSTLSFKLNYTDPVADSSGLLNFYQNHSVQTEGLSIYHILFDFYSSVAFTTTSGNRCYIAFSVEASNNLSSLYLIFQ